MKKYILNEDFGNFKKGDEVEVTDGTDEISLKYKGAIIKIKLSETEIFSLKEEPKPLAFASDYVVNGAKVGNNESFPIYEGETMCVVGMVRHPYEPPVQSDFYIKAIDVDKQSIISTSFRHNGIYYLSLGKFKHLESAKRFLKMTLEAKRYIASKNSTFAFSSNTIYGRNVTIKKDENGYDQYIIDKGTINLKPVLEKFFANERINKDKICFTYRIGERNVIFTIHDVLMTNGMSEPSYVLKFSNLRDGTLKDLFFLVKTKYLLHRQTKISHYTFIFEQNHIRVIDSLNDKESVLSKYLFQKFLSQMNVLRLSDYYNSFKNSDFKFSFEHITLSVKDWLCLNEECKNAERV